MKTYSSEALAAMESGEAIYSAALHVHAADEHFRIWGGHGDLTLDGPEGGTFTGVGDRLLAMTGGGSLGGAERGDEITLSGVDAATLALTDLSGLRGAAVVIWELVFDGGGATLLSANVEKRGRIDRLSREDRHGGDSVMRAMVEGAARGLRRLGGQRMFSDADQRLIKGTDGGARFVSAAPMKTLYWGGRPPVRAGRGVGDRRGGGGDAVDPHPLPDIRLV